MKFFIESIEHTLFLKWNATFQDQTYQTSELIKHIEFIELKLIEYPGRPLKFKSEYPACLNFGVERGVWNGEIVWICVDAKRG